MKSRATPKVWVDVSTSALRHNAQTVREIVRPSNVMAVVKSNAYGHGLELVVKAVQPDVSTFAVDSLSEALLLKKIGVTKPILILGYLPIEDTGIAVENGFSFVVYRPETLSEIGRLKAGKKKANIHLKIETGTTRQGLEGEPLMKLARTAARMPGVHIEGAYTHFANIEDTANPEYAMGQLARFQKALADLDAAGIHPPVVHAASSAAAFLYPKTRFSAIRLGISLYGYWPSDSVRRTVEKNGTLQNLQPALTWKTVVAQVKSVKRGTPVSYGLTERVTRESRIAVLPVGYWDGYDRELSSKGSVLIRGHRAKIVGRVCMNMMMADVTDVPGVKSGDEVVLIGSQKSEVVTAEDIASKIGSISYEVLARINPLIERRAVK